MNSVYDILSTKATNLHYLKRYVKFIQACSDANKNIDATVYTERHHIVPKAEAFWPEYTNLTKNNLNRADLTARQHVIAHWILAKALGGGMWTALWSMVNGKGSHYRPQGDRKFNSKLVAVAKEENAKAHSLRMIKYHADNPDEAKSRALKGENNPFYGKQHTPETLEYLRSINTGKELSQETKDRISAAQMGRVVSDQTKRILSEGKLGRKNHFYGKQHSDETKRKMSIANSRPSKKKGIPLSDEVKAKMSAANKGKVQPVVTCPYCNKDGAAAPMNRWHFDNCKQKGL